MPVSTSARASSRLSKWREPFGFRVIPGQGYPVGALLQIAPLDLQVLSDMKTVRPTAASASVKGVVGLVSEEWAGPGVSAPTMGGFNTQGLTVAPGSAGSASLGTDIVPVTVRGIHMRALIDNTNGVAAITHGLALSSSQTTIGKLQQAAATPLFGAAVATALLNSVAPFNTLGTGALTAATQTITVGGAPAPGDIYTIPVQVPFSDNNQGVAVFRNVTVGPLTAAQAVSTTTAAAAIVAALTADPVFAQYYTAANAAAVITVTVTATNQFRIGGQGMTQQGSIFGSSWELTTAGTVGNSLALGALVVVTGGGTLTAGGGAAGFTGYPTGSTLFTGGAGYVGTCPVFVGGLFG